MFYRRIIRARVAALRAAVPALPVAVGTFCGQVIAWFMSPSMLMLLAICLGGVVLFSARRFRAVLGGVCLGIATGSIALLLHPVAWSGSDIQVLVRVEDPPARRQTGEISFIGEDVLGPQRRTLQARSLDVPWRNASLMQRGDVVWVRGSLAAIDRPFNPFSWKGWLWRRGVSGEMRALFVSKPVERAPQLLDSVRGRIRERVTTITEDRRGGALFLSMALGERDVLSRHVEESFKALGLSHLLVVSGYQVSLVFAVLFSIFLRVSILGRPTLALRHCATWCSFLGAAGYVALVGAEMSSVRALIAAACLCVALVIDRRHRFAQRWATALLVIQVVYPWALFDVGVLLTFAALGGIGVGSVIGWRDKLASVVWVTVCVWLFTSLVTTVWIGSISPFGLILNLLLAGPWSVLNCTLGVVGLGLAMAHLPPGEWLVWFVGCVNEWIAQALLWLVAHLGMRGELEGAGRWLLVAVLVGLSVGVCRKAVRRYPVLRVQALLR